MQIRIVFIISCFLLMHSSLYGQQEKLQIDGAIQIADSEKPTPDPGTIRWTGTDFEGWNGLIWVSLTGNASVGSVTDIDGNSYQTIRIGNQEWLAENLRVTKYNDTTAIDQITNSTIWSGLDNGAWCWYNNSSSYDIPYGKLYNWYAVSTAKLCPTNWHVPTDAEWTTLSDYLGGELKAIGKMKETGLAHWISPNIGATNERGFTGLPGGERNFNGLSTAIGSHGYWWSSSEFSGSEAWFRSLNHMNNLIFNVFSGAIDKKEGLSVRCLGN